MQKKVWEEKDFQLPLSAMLTQAIAPTWDGFYISGFIFAFTNRTFLSGMRSVKAKPAVRFNSKELFVTGIPSCYQKGFFLRAILFCFFALCVTDFNSTKTAIIKTQWHRLASK